MDRQKTGALIAQMRKERGLTQRELAEQLHVSDRAVSKWERGAGFPDVSMLVPLAEALGLSVLELLQGEQSVPCDSEGAARLTLDSVQQNVRNGGDNISAPSWVWALWFCGWPFAA